MDSNHDKQIQSLLCYRYTIRQNDNPKPTDFAAGVKFVGKGMWDTVKANGKAASGAEPTDQRSALILERRI